MEESFDRYLQSESQSGSFDSEGAFTVSLEKRLEKIAAFQLPYQEGWILKLLQALVARGVTGEVRISVFTHKSVIRYELEHDWDFKELEADFFELEPSEDPAVECLKIALWSTAIGEGRPFELRRKGESQTLCFARNKFFRENFGARATHSELSVWHFRDRVSTGNYEKTQVALSRNLRRAFCYPVPLLLNLEPIHGLEFCPYHGWNTRTVSLGHGFLQPEIPEWRVPSSVTDKRALGLYTSSTNNLPPMRHSALAYQFGYQLNQEGAMVRSHFHWVMHGILVDSDPLPLEMGAASVGIYLSAEGLPTDATTLHLRNEEQREIRKALALQALKPQLQDYDFVISESREARRRRVVREAAGLFTSAGGFAVLALKGGLLSLGAPFALIGGFWYFSEARGPSPRKRLRPRETEMREALKQLKEQLLELKLDSP